ncbi:MAG: energy transducer TonB [Tannerella sp.]|jgi:TonB family protein|nr:energy transducer TonB [Tannerella sp.]
MKRQILILGLLISAITYAFGQSNLTPEQISNRNYQEVVMPPNPNDPAHPDSVPDKFPMYPDGVQGLVNHVSTHMTYPRNAYLNGVQGRVILNFVVEKDGTIGDIEILQSAGSELDEEAIRVVRSTGIWVPGYKNEKPVKVKYTFPFNFKI